MELPELRELRAVTGPDGLAMSRKVRGIICSMGEAVGDTGQECTRMQLRGGQHGMRRRSTQLHYPSVAVPDSATNHRPIVLTFCPMSIQRRKKQKKVGLGWLAELPGAARFMTQALC